MRVGKIEEGDEGIQIQRPAAILKGQFDWVEFDLVEEVFDG